MRLRGGIGGSLTAARGEAEGLHLALPREVFRSRRPESPAVRVFILLAPQSLQPWKNIFFLGKEAWPRAGSVLVGSWDEGSFLPGFSASAQHFPGVPLRSCRPPCKQGLGKPGVVRMLMARARGGEGGLCRLPLGVLGGFTALTFLIAQ